MSAFLTSPGYTNPPPVVQNQVVVVQGHNWDLSRSAAATPVVRVLPPPEVAPPVRQPEALPPGPPITVYPSAAKVPVMGVPTAALLFAHNSAKLTSASRLVLASLRGKGRVVVLGHAAQGEARPSFLALERARAVARALRQEGAHVYAMRSFSNELPLVQPATAAKNARVEVFVLPR